MRTSMARLKQASHPNSRASSRIGGAPMPQLPTTLRVERILALPKARCRISVTLSCHALWATHTMEWWALVVVIPATTIFIGVSAACTLKLVGTRQRLVSLPGTTSMANGKIMTTRGCHSWMPAGPILGPHLNQARQCITTMHKTRHHSQSDAMGQVQVVAWSVSQHVVLSTQIVTMTVAVALPSRRRPVASAMIVFVHVSMQRDPIWAQTSRNFQP